MSKVKNSTSKIFEATCNCKGKDCYKELRAEYQIDGWCKGRLFITVQEGDAHVSTEVNLGKKTALELAAFLVSCYPPREEAL